jgi:hypothetical protein
MTVVPAGRNRRRRGRVRERVLKGASRAVNRNVSVDLAGELIAGCEPQ